MTVLDYTSGLQWYNIVLSIPCKFCSRALLCAVLLLRYSNDDSLAVVSNRLASAWRMLSKEEKSKYHVPPLASSVPKKPIRSGYVLFIKEKLVAGR